MGEYKSSKFYDQEFVRQKHYTWHFKTSAYLQLWKTGSQLIKNEGCNKILELGCGPGQLAHLLACDGFKIYTGRDFSKVALDMAKERLKLYPEFKFEYDLLELHPFDNVEYDIIIGTEMLEHVKDDYAVINNIPKGVKVIFSVPCFDAAAHVRFFKGYRDVSNRYKKYINIGVVERITIPSTDKKVRDIILFKGVKR